MQGRVTGHLPLCASILPADMPVKDPAVSSQLRCEAARALLALALGKAGPGGAAAKAQRMRGGIAEIVRKVFAIDGMPLVLAAACAGAL